MKKTWLSVLLAVCLLFSWGLAQAAEQVPAGSTAAPSATTEKVPAATADKPAFAIEDRPTYFLIYDQSGAMNSSIYRSWRQMVKTVYHFPTYKIIEDADQVRQNVRASLSGRPDQQELARIAGEVKAEVLVIVVVHSMYERIESGISAAAGGMMMARKAMSGQLPMLICMPITLKGKNSPRKMSVSIMLRI
jgi:hypothetical protein